MAKFRFVFEEGDAQTSVDADLTDRAAARAEALSTTRKSMAEAVFRGRDPRGWRTRVYDPEDRCIVSLGFDDIAK